MKSLSKILLPVDFSERSLGAARYAKTLADRFHSELTLLHILTPPHYEFGALEIGGSMLTELYSNRTEQVEKELETFLAGELAGLDVSRVVLEGDPARQIVEYAHAEKVGLIVMPTHGYGPFRQFILGSITAKVLHDADCPVWTGVHMEEAPQAEPMSFQEIVCAIDLGPQSCKALEWATSMQKEFKGRLTVVHVMANSPATGQADERAWEMELAVRDDMARLQQRFGTQAELAIEAGDPPHVVCEMAKKRQANLLVIGRGSAAGVFGRLRTNAYGIIRQSPCPVVSV
ncbi:MAG TPA: universal stress protein [Bryobacteraceae bacterium]|jgi:nucleotide-binding universal stress UspA family protein|nr:universal stress protein [Bryobacteraceae bacterium]